MTDTLEREPKISVGKKPEAVLILGDCRGYREVLLQSDAMVSDVPYGIGYKVNVRAAAGRGAKLKATAETFTQARAAIEGDDEPFDPTSWLTIPKVALFGANHFCSRLPDNGRWFVWDKRGDSAPDDHSDCELIWTNAPGKTHRIHRQKWRGLVREGEENCSRSKKLHPNQKPVALLTRLLQELDLQPGQTVADPYMGSGSTAVAALRMGLSFIGAEIDPNHFATARSRIARELEKNQSPLVPLDNTQ